MTHMYCYKSDFVGKEANEGTTLYVHTFVGGCLATKILKAHMYLEAEVVEEVMGWLG